MKTTHGHSDANGRNVFSAIIYRNFAVKSLGKMKRLARLDGHSARAAVRGTAGLEWTLDTGHWTLVIGWHGRVTTWEISLTTGAVTHSWTDAA